MVPLAPCKLFPMVCNLRKSGLVHVVLISFRENASTAQKQWVFSEYQKLAGRCGGKKAGILFWQVDHNLDQRKGWHLIELAIFRDHAALQCFRAHPSHAELTAVLREIADWAVGDLHSSLISARLN
jgi:hypothetical protein